MAFADGNGIRHTFAGARSNPSPGLSRFATRSPDAHLWRPVFGHPEPAAALRSVITLALIASVGLAPRLEAQSPAFARFVDRYLDDFAQRHPRSRPATAFTITTTGWTTSPPPGSRRRSRRSNATRRTPCLRPENTHTRRARRSAHPARHHRRVAARTEDPPELAPQSNAVRLGTRRWRAQPDDHGERSGTRTDAADHQQAAPASRRS